MVAGRGEVRRLDRDLVIHLREQHENLSGDLQRLQLLLDLSERLATESDVRVACREILHAAVRLLAADAGTLRILDAATGDLMLLAQYGLDDRLTGLERVSLASKFPNDPAPQTHEHDIVYFDDDSTDPASPWRLYREAGLGSAQAFWLRSRAGQPLGLMTLHWRGRHEPIERERRFLDALARQAGDALERRRFEESLRDSEALLTEELAELKLLQDVSTRLIEADDVGALLQQLLEATVALMHSDCGSVQVLDETRDELRMLAWQGLDEAAARHWMIVRAGSTTACDEALRLGRRVVVRDVAEWAALAQVDRAHLGRCGIRALQSTPLLSRSGGFVGVLSTHWRTPTEPTERQLRLLDVIARQAADLIERRRAEEKLRASDRRKDEFLATLAHELRNPLAPLRHGVQIARMRSRSDESFQRVVEMMDRQLSHLVRLVDDLLDVGRIHSGKLELRKRTVSLNEVVVNAIEGCHARLDAQQQEVTLQPTAASLRVRADADRLVQVFTNLLSNASKFSPPRTRIHVTLARERDQAVVAVRDEGVGIEADDLGRVFDLFSQVRAHQGRADGGLGIGLAIVRSLVQLHGGSVDVSSPGTGRGSIFTVRLPLVPLPASGPTVTSDMLAAASTTPRRVLVVDDNVDAGDSLVALLGLLGHDVSVARDGYGAVEQARARTPELVFLDLGMPGIDGLETARRLRALPGGRDIVIAALTGWGLAADRQRTREAGFDLHIVKPVDDAALVHAFDCVKAEGSHRRH
jgi:signal transduction histidine kinase/CheY-like chemotaxis protein